MARNKAPKFFDGSKLGLLSGNIDRYKGIVIKGDSINSDQQAFTASLTQSLDAYKKEGLRAVWLKLAKDKAHLAGVAANDGGFDFHHAKKDYVMLTKWLDPNQENMLPGFASHYVGCGGLVLNSSRDKILCI